MGIITEENLLKAIHLHKIPIPGLGSFLMKLTKLNKVNELFDKSSPFHRLEFIDKVLENAGVRINFNQEELKNIPEKEAFIAVANHPYGGIDGLAFLKLMAMVRPESKQMSNFLLKGIPNLSEYLVAVNPFETIKNSSSISGIKQILKLLKDGIPIGIFPAGEVSTYQIDKRHVTDKLWNPIIGKLIFKANVPVIPVYFHGHNGFFFNLLSAIHPMLRTAQLPAQLVNKQGHALQVRIGKPIFIQDISYQNDSNQLLDYLRAKTYALGAGIKKKRSDCYCWPRIRKNPEEIIAPITYKGLVSDIEHVQDWKIWTEGKYEVYIAPASKIPNILQEIGRLREITFREIGEGTNKKLDLDKYDNYYNHLFIWDSEAKMLVGAYRLGKGNEIFASIGANGFYISELFKIQTPIYPILQKSLELGRSWIRKEYQLNTLPLFLLWKGILKYLTENPKYNYLIGPVSISNNFSKLSKSLIVDFITKNYFDDQLAQYVEPQKKFKVDFSNIDANLLMQSKMHLKDLDSLISEIETARLRVPVLLRQYLSLNGKIICFSIDSKFSNSLDAFLFVDLQKIPQDILEKIGKDF